MLRWRVANLLFSWKFSPNIKKAKRKIKNDTTWCFLKMNDGTTFRDTLHMADDVSTATSVAFKIQLYGIFASILIKSVD